MVVRSVVGGGGGGGFGGRVAVRAGFPSVCAECNSQKLVSFTCV